MNERKSIDVADPTSTDFKDAGGAETQAGQVEIVAGSAEHERELKAYPNVTSYAPEVNVVLPKPDEDGEGGADGAPKVIDVPHVAQEGSKLTCTMGNWEGEPTSYTYAWVRDGSEWDGDGSNELTLDEDDVGVLFSCTVSATNDAGTTEGPPSNIVLIEALDG